MGRLSAGHTFERKELPLEQQGPLNLLVPRGNRTVMGTEDEIKMSQWH